MKVLVLTALAVAATAIVPAAAQARPSTVTAGVTDSQVWGGYAAHGSTPFSGVSATWTQPAATCTSKRSSAAFFVGLDGYTSSTLEQIGTVVSCAGTPTYAAFYALGPNPPVTLALAVHPGDTITARVSYASGVFTLTISDLTTGKHATQKRTLSSATRESAEVIVDDPCCTSGDQPLPLTNFSTATFSNVRVNGSALANSHPTKIVLVTAHNKTKATTSPLTDTGTAFTITWQHA